MLEIAGGILIALAVIFVGLPLLGAAIANWKTALYVLGSFAAGLFLIFAAPSLIRNSDGFLDIFSLAGVLGCLVAVVLGIRQKKWQASVFFGICFCVWTFMAYTRFS